MKAFRITLFLLLITNLLRANNINVDSISLVDQDATADTVRIQFDLSWDNSWRLSTGPANWDAAWVFVKFRENGGAWEHANINYVDGTNDGHSVPAGATIRTASNGIGCFIYRSTDGQGSVDWKNIELGWDYGNAFVDDDAILDIQVFAIEMVYVPTDSFYLGGGFGTEDYKFYEYPSTGNSYYVTSESAINVGNTNGYLNYEVGSGGDHMGPVPAAFPKGYEAFYCMKYEASEGQWVAFFNTLTSTQKSNRDITDANGKNSDNEVERNTISWSGGSSSAISFAEDRACGYLSLGDMLAYMDWAGLRPMTELEFEKACRGPGSPNAEAYCWGTANVFGEDYTLSNSGLNNETIDNPGVGCGNASWASTDGGINGPLRCGIFAASAINKNREETGGSYYGIMELSGNLRERVVNIANATGRGFTGLHGDGILNASGEHTTNNWPDVVTGIGGSVRGGWYGTSYKRMWVSDRLESAVPLPDRGSSRGIRCVRTAPN